MGVYSNNRLDSITTDFSDQIVANESYVGEVGLARMLVEAQQNELAFFEGIIVSDISEAVLISEGASMEELVSLQEGAIQGFFSKFVAFLKSIWEKVKGIFKTLYAKVIGVMATDGKKLVDKYKKDVLGKDYSKFKFKYAKPKHEIISLDVFKEESSTTSSEVDEALEAVTGDRDPTKEENKGNDRSSDKKLEAVKELWEKKFTEESEDDNYLLKTINKKVSGLNLSDMKDFEKEMEEWFHEDQEELEGGSLINTIMTELYGYNKKMDAYKKEEKKIESDFNKLIGFWDKKQKEIVKKEPSGNSKYNTYVLSYIAVKRARVTYCQTAFNKLAAASIKEMKFQFAQNKAVWMKAYAFNPKSVKESAVLEDAIYESTFDETYSDLEAVEFAV